MFRVASRLGKRSIARRGAVLTIVPAAEHCAPSAFKQKREFAVLFRPLAQLIGVYHTPPSRGVSQCCFNLDPKFGLQLRLTSR